MPLHASPTAEPTMTASASGMSTTRSEPKRSCRPSVARKTPPLTPDVLAEHDHALVALQRVAERRADRLDHRHLGHQPASRAAAARWASRRPGARA